MTYFISFLALIFLFVGCSEQDSSSMEESNLSESESVEDSVSVDTISESFSESLDILELYYLLPINDFCVTT